MSIDTVNQAIRRFLKEEKCKVLALKGAWGVGKTYAWRTLMKEEGLEYWPKDYAYASLFGLTSLAELRVAILASRFGANPENANMWQRFTEALPPWLKSISAGIDVLAPSLIKNMLICLDDFERLNTAKVTHDQVLGFISNLKENADCKIVLILNDEKLAGPDHPYRLYREKVVDQELLFAPTSDEATVWGLQKTLPHRELVKKYTVALGISNVRILGKISKVIEELMPAFDDKDRRENDKVHQQVIKQTIPSAVLLAWCYYDPAPLSSNSVPTAANSPPVSNSPPPSKLDFVKTWDWRKASRTIEEHRTPEEERLVALLDDYGYEGYDEFDATILKVIENGYLEESGFRAAVLEYSERLRGSEAEDQHTAAWRDFRAAFDDSDQDSDPKLVDALVSSFKDVALYLPPMRLEALVELLREIGDSHRADELIEFYLKERSEKSKLYDFDSYVRQGLVTDPKICQAFAAQIAASARNRSLPEAVEAFANRQRTPTPQDLAVISAATADDFHNLFKGKLGALGKPLYKIVEALQDPERAPEPARRSAKAALLKIAGESKLNAARVRRMGIDIPARNQAPPT